MPRFILITRHPSECHELQEMLNSTDLVLRPYPVLRLEDVNDKRGWKRISKALPIDQPINNAWILLASPRAGSRLVASLKRQEYRHLLDLPVAAVGEGTAKAAKEAGLKVEVIGPGTGLGLSEQLNELWQNPTVVLFACGRERRPELPAALKAHGHTIIPVELYTMKPTPSRELPPLGPSLEAVVLTSPRSAQFYLEGVGGHPLPCPHWALGPTTRDSAEMMGISCRIPTQPNLNSLAEELCQI